MGAISVSTGSHRPETQRHSGDIGKRFPHPLSSRDTPPSTPDLEHVSPRSTTNADKDKEGAGADAGIPAYRAASRAGLRCK